MGLIDLNPERFCEGSFADGKVKSLNIDESNKIVTMGVEKAETDNGAGEQDVYRNLQIEIYGWREFDIYRNETKLNHKEYKGLSEILIYTFSEDGVVLEGYEKDTNQWSKLFFVSPKMKITGEENRLIGEGYEEDLMINFPEFVKSKEFDEHCEFYDHEPKKMFDICKLYRAFLNFTIEVALKKKNIELSRKIFDWIEYLLSIEKIGNCGDEKEGTPEHDLCFAIQGMFLESLLNRASVFESNIDCCFFVPMLGEHSREVCKYYDLYWGARTPCLWTDEEWEKWSTRED